ncbi:MAG: hypothetical protein AAF485_21945 [Chloroflexota bacterium]
MVTKIQGWIAEYSAQGMEGETWLTIQDKSYSRDRQGGWRLEGMCILEIGDQLTIFGLDGQLLWSGLIQPRRTGFLGLKKTSPNHPDWSPETVDLVTWRRWFRHSPPLEAILIRNK